jgi:hypothetical protein
MKEAVNFTLEDIMFYKFLDMNIIHMVNEYNYIINGKIKHIVIPELNKYPKLFTRFKQYIIDQQYDFDVLKDFPKNYDKNNGRYIDQIIPVDYLNYKLEYRVYYI